MTSDCRPSENPECSVFGLTIIIEENSSVAFIYQIDKFMAMGNGLADDGSDATDTTV